MALKTEDLSSQVNGIATSFLTSTRVLGTVSVFYDGQPVAGVNESDAQHVVLPFPPLNAHRLGVTFQDTPPAPTVLVGDPVAGDLQGKWPNLTLRPGLLPTQARPIGPAGGVLAGTFPDQLTFAPGALPTQLPPIGPASGDLRGFFPSPKISLLGGTEGDVMQIKGGEWRATTPTSAMIGLKGDKGDQGDDGAQGEAGAAGAQGTVGPPGVPGPDVQTQVGLTADISVPTNTPTRVVWTREYFNLGVGVAALPHDLVTSPSHFTARTPGRFSIPYEVWFAPNANGYRQVQLYKNGALFQQSRPVPSVGISFGTVVDGVFYAQAELATDYFELFLIQTSGSPLSVVAGTLSQPQTLAGFALFSTGPKGEQGSQGIQGNPGTNGINGSPGTPGASIVWRATWSGAVAYVANEAVEYLGSMYVAVQAGTGHTPSTSPSFWNLAAAAGTNGTNGMNGTNGTNGANGANGTSFTFRGGYLGSTNYAANDVVSYNGAVYIAVDANIGSTPPSIHWTLMVPAAAGVLWRGTWSFVLSYQTNDLVFYPNDGNNYVAVAPSSGVIPPSTGFWELFVQHGAQGVQGATGPSGGVAGATGAQGNQGNAGPAGATSNAGYRQTPVTPSNTSGAQAFVVSTASTPIATDRVYVIVNGQECRTPLFFTVSIVAGVSFTVTWIGTGFDLSSTDDVLIVWFTTPP